MISTSTCMSVASDPPCELAIAAPLVKKCIMTTAFVMLTVFLFSQEVVSSGGASYSGNTANLEFTIGEISSEMSGIHSTSIVIVLSTIDEFVELSIYPNPTKNFVKINSPKVEWFDYQLFNQEGKLVRDNRLHTRLESIDLASISEGMYLLKLTNPTTKKTNTYRIIKK